MITFANRAMFPALIEIWQQSFGDSEEYIRMFLDANFDRIRTIVYLENNIPVSVAYLMPVEYRGVRSKKDTGHGKIPCLYLYAAATHPAYRGKGYFGQILSYVKENITEPIILVPGEETLIGYYEKQGLKLWHKAESLRVTEQNTDICLHNEMASKEALQVCTKRIYHIENITPEMYYRIRESGLDAFSHFRWDEESVKYICKENQYCNGRQVFISYVNKIFLVMFRTEGKFLYVLELLTVSTQIDSNTQGNVQENAQKIDYASISELYLKQSINEYKFIDMGDKKKDAEACANILMQETGCKVVTFAFQPPYMLNKAWDSIPKDTYFNLILG